MHRTTRRLTLTEAGRNYLDAVERILDEIEEAEAVASVEAIEVRGTLRLNAPVSFGVREIAPLLPEFARAHPLLTIDLGLNDRRVDLVEEGWDLVVRIGSLTGSTMVVRRLAPCRMVVCAAPDYLARHGEPRTIADLTQQNCLGYTLSRIVGAERWSFGRDGATSVPVSGNLKATSGDALVAAAIAGQGIIYQPTFLVSREIAAGRLRPLKLDHDPVELDGIFAGYPSDRRPPAKVRAFIEFLSARFGPAPPWDRG